MRVKALALQPIAPDEFRMMLEGEAAEVVAVVLSRLQVRELAQACTEATFAVSGAVSWQAEPEWTGTGWQLGR